MDPRCCSQAVPSYIHQESGRMKDGHSHCYTILVGVFGCPRKFWACMHHESTNNTTEALGKVIMILKVRALRETSWLTVNSVTWMELEMGPKTPASLYIDRINATQVVDFPSLYTHSSCSGIVSSSSKGIPRFSVSTIISCKSKPWKQIKMRHPIQFRTKKANRL